MNKSIHTNKQFPFTSHQGFLLCRVVPFLTIPIQIENASLRAIYAKQTEQQH